MGKRHFNNNLFELLYTVVTLSEYSRQGIMNFSVILCIDCQERVVCIIMAEQTFYRELSMI